MCVLKRIDLLLPLWIFCWSDLFLSLFLSLISEEVDCLAVSRRFTHKLSSQHQCKAELPVTDFKIKCLLMNTSCSKWEWTHIRLIVKPTSCTNSDRLMQILPEVSRFNLKVEKNPEKSRQKLLFLSYIFYLSLSFAFILFHLKFKWLVLLVFHFFHCVPRDRTARPPTCFARYLSNRKTNCLHLFSYVIFISFHLYVTYICFIPCTLFVNIASFFLL